MSITGKWVHFEDTLELEAFLTLCEEKVIRWPNNLKPRCYLEVDLKRYRENQQSFIIVGYAVIKDPFDDIEKLWPVNPNLGVGPENLSVENYERFSFTEEI